jgi:AraC-like DNA-binding protein
MGVTAQFSWVDRLIAADIALPPNTTSVNLIARILASAESRGARRPALLDAIGIGEMNSRNQLSRLPGSLLVRLFQAVERELTDPLIAMKMGRDSRPRCFSDIGYATRFLPTAADVFDANIHMQTLRQNLYRVSLVQSENRTSLRWNLLEHDPQELAALIEFSVSTYVRLARELWWDDTRMLSVSLQHRPRFDAAEYSRMLGCPVVFGAAFTEVEFSTAQMSAPNPMAHPKLTAAVQGRQAAPMLWFDAGQRVSALTYFHIYTELNKSPVTLQRISRFLDLSERTLRRKLDAEGRPFRNLLDQVRMDLCDLYRIEGHRSFGEIAELLGYGELSAFTRAAKRWYGTAPSHFWKDIEGENGGRSKD